MCRGSFTLPSISCDKLYFFLNKIMYSHFIFTRKNTSTLYLNFFFVKMKLLTFFRAYIGNKTNCDGPTATPPHHIWKLSVSIFLSFWPTSNVLKFVFSRKIVAHFCVAWKNLNFMHLLLLFTVWVSRCLKNPCIVLKTLRKYSLIWIFACFFQVQWPL